MRPTEASQTASWIPRHCLGWLLAAQLALIAPHVERLPVWVVIAWLLSALWRVQVFQGRWSFPNAWVKAALIGACVAGIRFSYGGWVGLEPTVALLIACFSFKLLEAASRRDAYLLLFLGYFVALTEFLFEQGLGTTLYMTVPILLLTTALLALQQQDRLRFDWQPLRAAALMAGQALPLMLLLFLVFPRLPPLWQVPMPGAAARTGMSDEMAPGDIAQLSQSADLAFRVAFDGPVPARAELYWRGLVFDTFDGRRWRAGGFGNLPLQQPAPSGTAVEYQVYMEPTHQPWLFALQRPYGIDSKTLLTSDYRLLAREPVHEKFAYRARAYPHAPLDLQLDPRLRSLQLSLPARSNPRAQAWAAQLRARNDDDSALIEQVLTTFREQPFVYTLRPPLLGEHSVDEFLFDSRRGFCEHYASSFAFVMRAAGIPARVVAGYQGGEVNPLTGTVLLHQFDAHAWVEVWLAGRGWVRVDPTAAVAPQRIESGLEPALQAGEFLAQAPLSASRYRNLDLINSLRLRFDALNYGWTRWVVNYRDDTQESVLESLLGRISPLRMALFLVGGGAAVLGIVALVLLGRNLDPRPPPAQRLYQRFCSRFERLGYPRPAGMAPGEYARWLVAQRPQWQVALEITECYEALSYRRLKPEQQRQMLLRMRGLVNRL